MKCEILTQENDLPKFSAAISLNMRAGTAEAIMNSSRNRRYRIYDARKKFNTLDNHEDSFGRNTEPARMHELSIQYYRLLSLHLYPILFTATIRRNHYYYLRNLR